MTAQEAQNLLEIEPPFTAVELKSAHKNALVAWFPAQFMGDRAQLAKALERTARIHEAYDVLLPKCEVENPYRWVEEAKKQVYDQTPAPESRIEPPPPSEPATPAAPELAPREEPAGPPVNISTPLPEASPLAEVAIVPVPMHATEPEVIPEPVEKAALPQDASIHATVDPSSSAPLRPVAPLEGDASSTGGDASSAAAADPERPQDPGGVPAAWRTETTHATRPATISESATAPDPSVKQPWEKGWLADLESTPHPPATTPVVNPFLHEIGPLKTVPRKPVDAAPKVELRAATPRPLPEPAPADLATAPVQVEIPVSQPVPPQNPDAGPASAVAPRMEPPITQVRPPKVVISPRLRRTPILSPPAPPPAPSPVPDLPAPVLPAAPPVAKPKPAAHDASAALAEEASAAVQASHHAPAPASAAFVSSVSASEASTTADSSVDAERAGDHALVPALGDRYHPAEREASPSTDSSRHLPARPVAPSRTGRKNGADESEAAGTPSPSRSSQPVRASLSPWQKVLRFLLGAVCIGGFGYGIYWLSQSNVGRDPWGMKPGSGGPGERVRQMAFDGLKRGAENGNAEAQMAVARAYLQGKNVAENPEEAVRWFRKAAEQGNVDAQYALGDAYKNGTGVPQDNAEALKWYRMAEANREKQKAKEEKEEDIRLR